MSERSDFEFLKGAITDFFNKKSIKDTIVIIEDKKITGWEKWLQIEFAKFCNERSDVSEWVREWRYDLDKRVSKSKSVCSVDFSIKQKHKQSWVAVEIKQKDMASNCIKSMQNDIKKLYKIRGSQDDIRTIWCVGIHRYQDPKSILSHIAKYSTINEIFLNPKHIETKRIGKTGYAFTIF